MPQRVCSKVKRVKSDKPSVAKGSDRVRQRDFKNMLDLKFTSSVKVEITGYYRAERRVT